jgi:hypothetical protein
MFKNLIRIFIGLSLFSCGKEPVPKPKGDLRLEYPNPKYLNFLHPAIILLIIRISPKSKMQSSRAGTIYLIRR